MFEFLTAIDYAIVAKIVILDIILAVDNAILIAMACSALDEKIRNKAMMLGIAGAIVARIFFLAVGFELLEIVAVKLLAGLTLLYVAYKLINDSAEDKDIKAKPTLLGAATTIVLADIAMSLDGVVGVIGAASNSPHALEYAIFGVVISIPMVMFASKGLIAVIEKFPVIAWLGAALIAWIGISMSLHEPFVAEFVKSFNVEILPTIIAVVVTAATMAVTYYKSRTA